MEERNLSLVEAAARLGVSPYTLRSWSVYQKRVPYMKMGRRLLFARADLEAFERRSRVPGREE